MRPLRNTRALAVWLVGLSLTGCSGSDHRVTTGTPPGASLPPLESLEIQWNAQRGTPDRVLNPRIRMTHRTGVLAESVAARLRPESDGFLRSLAPLFRARPGLDTHAFRDHLLSDTSVRFEYQQLYRGLPVRDETYSIVVREDGRFVTLFGTFWPDLDLSVEPVVSSQEALTACRLAFGSADPASLPSARLCVFTGTGTPILAYECVYPTVDAFTSWLAYVDAKSGQVVEARNTFYK